MLILSLFSLPFQDPVLVFAVILLVILFSPMIFDRFRIPGILGLILSGVLLGPHGFGVLERDESVVLFSTIGLLYIMFLAGLEMDMDDFRKNRNRSIVFGVLTFIIPLILGYFGTHYILGYSPVSSFLLASMFSTHTLIAYPIIGRLGITQNRTVTLILGGTILTDAAVLIILAVITNLQKPDVSALFWVQFVASLAAFVFFMLWGVPRIGRWFFKYLEGAGNSQFLFILAVVFISGFLAHAAGAEPIIGAFLAGLALNQLIPKTSPLMHRTEFVGNTLFIPFFLISVGMLVDVRVLLKGPQALFVAAVIILISYAGKWLAAFLTQKIYKLEPSERNLIWGMSSSHAAATIAVVLIGYNIKLLDENALNGTIILILVSCLVSSIIAEKAGRKIAIAEEEKIPETTEAEERILLPIAGTEEDDINRLVDFALLIKNPKSAEPLLPLLVVSEHQAPENQIKLHQKKMVGVASEATEEVEQLRPVYRVDVSVSNGILRAVSEMRITEIVMPWNGKLTARDRYLGGIIDRVVKNTEVQTLFCKFRNPLNILETIVAVVPRNTEREAGFPLWVNTIMQLAKGAGAKIRILGSARTLEKMEVYVTNQDRYTVAITYELFEDWDDFLTLTKQVTPNDLLTVVLGRPHTISYRHDFAKVPRHLSRHFKDISFVILYPEQKAR
ncbi:cation:proton antiporter [Pontibacter sp. 172403-2]|uniref:cation:proton antiporter n=1 Tax=Pontibacter rufus TaxID=2791028 RepID=UPI0018AF6361|nr:cation:proton antiporter [Pontibacter sp. 172403-2]MBF9252559.1 cation:proton antiporter [Pontibacter sp. 172403-2]